MSHEGRTSRNSPNTATEHVSRDGVASAAGTPLALVTTWKRPEIVEPLRDDSEGDDSLVYADHDEDELL